MFTAYLHCLSVPQLIRLQKELLLFALSLLVYPCIRLRDANIRAL